MIRAACVGLLVALAGCPGIPQPLEAPQVSLRSAEVTGDVLAAELSVVNPNHEGLVLEAIDWQLELGDQPLARGRSEARVPVPALASAAARLRGALTAGQVARLGADLALSGTLHLRGERGLVAATFYGPVASESKVESRKSKVERPEMERSASGTFDF